ncbi:MAG: hypothetical protein IPO24_00830 [Bacteroidetes bacterium]|nr:hypothetical protein [Bacteroidota bacterium]
MSFAATVAVNPRVDPWLSRMLMYPMRWCRNAIRSNRSRQPTNGYRLLMLWLVRNNIPQPSTPPPPPPPRPPPFFFFFFPG